MRSSGFSVHLAPRCASSIVAGEKGASRSSSTARKSWKGYSRYLWAIDRILKTSRPYELIHEIPPDEQAHSRRDPSGETGPSSHPKLLTGLWLHANLRALFSFPVTSAVK